MTINPRFLFLIAVICFVLTTFGVRIGGHELLAPGLAFLAAGMFV